MEKYILAHDLGTSGNKAALFGLDGEMIGSELYEYKTYHPFPGFVEQEPADWWEAVCGSTKALLERTDTLPGEIACVCFSGQMMGCLPVDSQGEPLYKMITWADLRSVDQARHMSQALDPAEFYRLTGHRLSASYSAAKLLWLKEEQPGIYGRTYKMLQAKDYIIHRMTGAFVTDYSDASGTNLLDLRKKEWSDTIIKEMGIEPSMLPDLLRSADIAGRITGPAASALGLLEGTPVVAGGGDGVCACVGAGVVAEGQVYNVIGSSSWISMASQSPIYDREMRAFNWVHMDPTLYAPCGTMQSAGYSFKWAVNALCADDTEQARLMGISPYTLIDRQISNTRPGANGLLFLPYLMGERSPRWNPAAKGCFIGLIAGSSKYDMLRAILEGVGYNLKVILDIFNQAGYTVKHKVLNAWDYGVAQKRERLITLGVRNDLASKEFGQATLSTRGRAGAQKKRLSRH